MKKTCRDCVGCYRTRLPKTICTAFEWEDKRLKAAEYALHILHLHAFKRYYGLDTFDITLDELAMDMMSEYETCEEIMDGCERDKNMNKTCEELNDEQ